MAEHSHPNYNAGRVGVPGEQVGLKENMHHQSYQHPQQQQLQQDHAQQQLHRQQPLEAPTVSQHQQQQYYQQEPTRHPRQFDQQYQQSYNYQPTNHGIVQTNSATANAGMSPPAVVPASTNVMGDSAPGFSAGGIGVPGAQVETLDSLQPQTHYQQPIHQQQEQYIQQQHATDGARVPDQLSFFSQPTDSTTGRQQYVHESTPVHHSTEDATNFLVRGLGVGVQAECLPTTEEQQSTATSTTGTDTVTGANQPGELDTAQHASASRPPVGPFDPPAESTAADPTAPPIIFLQREATMRHDYETPVTTTTKELYPHKVHVASADAVAAADAAAAQAADAASRGRRRSSLAVLADRIRSATRSRSRSPSLSHRLSRTFSRHSCENDEEDSVGGPYKDVKIAQQEHLAKLRAEQEKNGITHNVDGLPIPPSPEHQRRRSSVSHILGLDKPWLSR